MGFVVSLSASATQITGGNNTTPATATLPTETLVGDLLFIFCVTNSSPTVNFTTPSGWSVVTNKNGTSSWGGAGAIFKKVATLADITTGSVTIAGPVQNTIWNIIAVRSTEVAGGSLSLTTQDHEETTATTSFTMPQMTVTHPSDLRLVFHVNGSTKTLTPPAEGVPKVALYQDIGKLEGSTQIEILACGIPSATDTGTTTWGVTGSSKLYTYLIVVSDGTSNAPAVGHQEDGFQTLWPIPVVGEEHNQLSTVDSVTGRGGGSGISVF